MANFSVPFSADAFPGYVPRRGILNFSSADLAHALFVTGRAPGDQWAHGYASVWEWLSRCSLIPAYVRSAKGQLMRSALADSLDRSEKATLSYALGQAMTTIFCSQVLNVRFLMHVDRYQRRYDVQLGAGQIRPDLIGQRADGSWIVAEAKGRSNAMESALRQKMVDQKGAVQTISGQRPVVALGCVASFPRTAQGLRGRMRVDAVDPPPDKQAVRLEIGNEEFLRAYYEPFVSAIEFGGSELRDGYVTSLVSNGLQVGVRSEIYEAFQRDPNGSENELGSLILELEERDRLRTVSESARADGTFVAADWDDFHNVPDYITEI